MHLFSPTAWNKLSTKAVYERHENMMYHLGVKKCNSYHLRAETSLGILTESALKSGYDWLLSNVSVQRREAHFILISQSKS